MFLICLFEKYYVKVNGKKWDEIYDPNKATVFKSEKEAKNWVKTNTTFEEYAKVVNSENSINEYNEWYQN